MRTLLTGGNLIDGLGQRHADTDLLLEDGRITQIGKGLNVADGAIDTTLDVAGKTVMPGLIDCHVHICRGNVRGEEALWAPGSEITEHEAGFLQESSPGLRDLLSGQHHARITLEAGYTTVRDVGLARGFSDIVLREAIARRADLFPGPRILASGGGLAVTGGHGWYFEDGVSGIVEVDGVDEARKAARVQLKAGADILKVMASRAGGTRLASGAPEMTIDEMRAICEEAHRMDKRVAAHAVGAEGIKNAIHAGVDTIEHACLADDEALDLMAERGTYLISTLYPYHNQAHLAVELGYPDDVAEPSLAIMEVYPQTIKRAYAKGVKMALGSDCGLRGLTPHGDNATELEMIVQLVGLSAMQAIELATHAGADALGLAEEVGTLEVGKQADIIVIDGDPLKDISLLKDHSKIALVIKQGDIVKHTQ
jgi:imidazolonepropionase-like amidohydrolase